MFLSEYWQSPQLPTKLTKPKWRRSWFQCKNQYWGSSLSFVSTPVVFRFLCGAQTVTSIMIELYIKMISYTEHPLENWKRRQSDCTQQYCASLEEKELLPGRRSISGRLSAVPGDGESKGRPTFGVNVPVTSNRKSSCTILYLPTGISVDFVRIEIIISTYPLCFPHYRSRAGRLPPQTFIHAFTWVIFPNFRTVAGVCDRWIFVPHLALVKSASSSRYLHR